MKTTDNTILITGGFTRLGLELADYFSSWGNKVIITDKSIEKLNQAVEGKSNITPFFFDECDEDSAKNLIQYLKRHHSDLNVYINDSGDSYTNSEEYRENNCQDKILANYLSGISVTEQLLPIIESQNEVKIVDLSSVSIHTVSDKKLIPIVKASIESYSRLLQKKFSSIEFFDWQAAKIDFKPSSQFIIKHLVGTFKEKKTDRSNSLVNYRHSSFAYAFSTMGF